MTIPLTFGPAPYTFVPVAGFSELWQAPLRASRGVYLWCFEFEGALLVNYVGKAGGSGGFETRLRTEHRDWERGFHNAVVDIDLLKRGVYRAFQTSMTPEHLRDQLRELRPLYRLILIPLQTDAECRGVEAGLVQLMRKDADVFQFLANKDKSRGYKKPCSLAFPSDAPSLIGMTAAIPRSLREAVNRARSQPLGS